MATTKAVKPVSIKRTSFYREVGNRIKVARHKRGFTQEGIAAAVGLSRTSLTNIEKGRQKLLLHTFADIAAALGTEMKDLLPEKKNVPDDVQKKLDLLPSYQRNFVEQTITHDKPNEHTHDPSESGATPTGNGSPKRSRGR